MPWATWGKTSTKKAKKTHRLKLSYCFFLQHFYIKKYITIFVSVSWCYFFNRVVEKEKDVYKDVNVPLTLFFNKVLLVKYTGISFADSTLQHQCKNKKTYSQSCQRYNLKGKIFCYFLLLFQITLNLQWKRRAYQNIDLLSLNIFLIVTLANKHVISFYIC